MKDNERQMSRQNIRILPSILSSLWAVSARNRRPDGGIDVLLEQGSLKTPVDCRSIVYRAHSPKGLCLCR